MSCCPECNEVLVNSRKCSNCSWRQVSARRQSSDRSCNWHTEGTRCNQEGSVLRDGQWLCSKHDAALYSGTPTARADGRKHMMAIKDILKRKDVVEVLVQEEPGANG